MINDFIDRIYIFAEKKYWYFFSIIILLSVFNLFYFLNSLPVQNWDEARNGVTAYEMVIHNDFIKNTYLGATDYWNTKPPLLFWSIALSYKIFGFTIFAMRFPSALFGLICIILTMLMVKGSYGKIASVFSGIILSTTYGFIHFHAARKGDYDSLMALILSICMLFLFLSDRKKYYFFICAFFAGLGFLAKSFAVIQVFGIIFFYLIISGRYKKLKIHDYIIFAVIFTLPVLFWGIMRFSADGTVFFQNMINNDLVMRTTSISDNLPTFSLWYFGVVLSHFFPWSVFLLFIPFYKNSLAVKPAENGSIVTLKLNDYFNNSLYILWILVPFIFFSLVTTKVDWYIVPVYPPMAILCGWYLADHARDDYSGKNIFLTGKKILFITGLFIFLFEAASVAVINSQDRGSYQNIFNVLKSYPRSTVYFVERGRNQAEVFLTEVIYGYKVIEAGDFNSVSKLAVRGDFVFTAEETVNIKSIENNYKIIERSGGYVLGLKQ